MKRKLIAFGRVVKSGLRNFIRNAWLAVAAIAVMVITLTILLFSVIANETFANTIQQITDRIDISVYLEDDIDDEQREDLIAQLNRLENVQEIQYISKDDALERYKEQNKDDVDLLVAISQTNNPLPASLQIKPHDPGNIEEIRLFLEQPEIRELQSEETSYSGDRKQAIDNIASATRFIRQAGLIGVAIFAVISTLIIFNTIRMAIFNRREELNIMRLLGASTWYIRGPFVVETILYGVVSAIISIILINLMFTVQRSAIDANTLGLLDVQFAANYYADHFWVILAVQLLIGVTIGGLSSYIATRRYLKFKGTIK